LNGAFFEYFPVSVKSAGKYFFLAKTITVQNTKDKMDDKITIMRGGENLYAEFFH